jgi:nucleoside-diphosphate-sugar epimerase
MSRASKPEIPLDPPGEVPRNDQQIEEMLSVPTPAAIAAAGQLDGDFAILGASGKMGITMAAMTRRALDAAGRKETRVLGVARFRDASARIALERFGVEPVACDLGSYEAVMTLPPATNVQYLAGQKFGTDSAPEDTWIENTVVPSHVARRFRDSRIVVYSTGCVYPFSPTTEPGATEASPPGFLGEYATTCIGRERVFTYYSKLYGTKTLLFRLNYSVELRYGVLVDVGQKILAGEPIDLAMGVTNVIWQRDACARALQCLLHVESPPKKLNITGDKIAIQTVAEKFAARLGRKALFVGTPQPTAWHIDPAESMRLFGPPLMPLDTMIDLVASHLERGGRLLGKPTHFEVRNGKF